MRWDTRQDATHRLILRSTHDVIRYDEAGHVMVANDLMSVGLVILVLRDGCLITRLEVK